LTTKTSRGLLLGEALFEHAHHIALLHDQKLFAVDLDLGARPFAEQYPVADFQIDWDELAGLVASAGPDSDDFPLGWLFLGGIRDDDATGALLLGINALDDDAVVKRTKFHAVLLVL